MLHQPLLTISLYGRWSTSGPDSGNAHFFTATLIQSREWEEREQTNKTNNMLRVNSSAERELCNTLCMCRLTLVWILAKIPRSNWNADSSWLDLLHWSGLSLMPTRLSALVSTVDCPCPCPVANSLLELLFQLTLFSRPLPLPVTVRFQVQNPLSCFAPKQTKESSAWRATYIVLHQVTNLEYTITSDAKIYTHQIIQYNIFYGYVTNCPSL